MFSSLSRYRDLPDVVTVDDGGHAVQSKALRPLPDVDGTLLHTVAEGDRLDALAQGYYGESRTWWHIADANPAFMSPLEMLGADPRGAASLSVEITAAVPAWAGLVSALRAIPGVEDARAGTAEMPAEEMTLVLPGTAGFTLAATLAAELDAAARTQAVSSALAAALVAKGVTLSADLRIARPETGTWVVEDRANGRIRVFRLAAGPTLSGYDAAKRWRWAVSIAFNRAVITAIELADAVAALGFSAGIPAEETAVGRRIVIPPRPA